MSKSKEYKEHSIFSHNQGICWLFVSVMISSFWSTCDNMSQGLQHLETLGKVQGFQMLKWSPQQLQKDHWDDVTCNRRNTEDQTQVLRWIGEIGPLKSQSSMFSPWNVVKKHCNNLFFFNVIHYVIVSSLFMSNCLLSQPHDFCDV